MLSATQNVTTTISILLSTFLTYTQEPKIRQTIITSSLTFASLYAFLKHTRLYHPSSNKANKAIEKEIESEWRSRIVGLIHATILTIGSLLCFNESWIHSHLSPSDAWKVIETSDAEYAMYTIKFAAVFVGYLQYDLWWLFTHPDGKGKYDISAIIHHILYILVTHFTLSGIYFVRSFAWLSFAELSTPFLHLRWFYIILQKKNSMGYFTSSILFAVTFLITRVLGYTIGLIDLWAAYPIWSTLTSLDDFNQVGFYLVIVALHMGYALNLFWSVKVVKALRKVLLPKVSK